jgi:hypothetical protein
MILLVGCREAFEHSRQGGAASNEGGVAVPAVVVSTAIAAAVPIEQLRQAAPQIPEAQRQAVGGLLKYIPEVKRDSPSIDHIFVPLPAEQQARDQARLEQYRQSAAPAQSDIEQSTKKEGAVKCDR